LMRIDAEEVKKQLLQLHLSGVIEYEPQKDTPQLYLLRNRIKAEDIQINMVAYNDRKEQFQKRMKQMVSYVKEETTCRSRVIGLYFGDAEINNCGICDNCLKQKATALTKEEFEAIHLRIVNILQQQPLQTKLLLEKLSGSKKEKIWKVLEFLQAENKIVVDGGGNVRLK
jgi:ATP-dependent DNA helicase RecQ